MGRRSASRSLVVALLALLAPVWAQETKYTYFVSRSVTGQTNRITIRQPTAGGRDLKLDGVYFCCSVACSPVISKGGSVSGGTAGTIVNLDDRSPSATSSATLDGTVTGATSISFPTISAGADRTHGGGLYLHWTGTPSQFTVELTSGSSGTLYIQLNFSEP